MKKILISLAIIGVVAGITLGITGAWWTDQGTSTNQSFVSGSLDLGLSNADSNYGDNVLNTWNVDKMAPGGTPYESSLYMKNFGSVKADYLKFTLVNSPSISGMDGVMRITKLEYAGKNLLTGGAGADFSNYYAEPLYCSVTVNNGGSIQGAIDSAAANAVICVNAGTYSGSLNINNDVTVVALNAPNSTNKATLSGTIAVSADGATVKGLDIEPGTVVYQGSGITVSANNVTIDSNVINGVNSPSAGSVKGIYAGDSTGTGTRSGLVITNNSITNITESYGRGAYGILLNYGAKSTGSVQNPIIKYNSISGINGGWAHAIGLETKTPNASITFNDIHDVAAAGADKVAIFLEDNSNGDTMVINKNNLGTNVLWGVGMAVTASGVVNAQNNWWGDFNPADQVLALGGGSIDTTNFAGNAFVGFVNGQDFYANGFADLYDFAHSTIVVENPDLLPNQGSYHTLKMGVQLDGPTTGSTFMGGTVGMNMTVTMGQGPAQ